jgi:transposase
MEAVKLVEAEGLSIDRAAKRLSVPKSSLSNWVRAARAGKLAKVGKGQRQASELELELVRTRKKLAEVKLNRPGSSRHSEALNLGANRRCHEQQALPGRIQD